MSRLARDGTANCERPNSAGANGDREKIILPVQLTASMIGKPYPVDPCPCYNVMTILTYTQTFLIYLFLHFKEIILLRDKLHYYYTLRVMYLQILAC